MMITGALKGIWRRRSGKWEVSLPPSLSLFLAVFGYARQYLICILASHSWQMERWIFFHGSPWQWVLFFLLAPFCVFLYPLSFIFRVRGNDEAVIYQWEIICAIECSCPLVSDLGSFSLQAFMFCREISSLDGAFLLRRLPFFCILSSLPLEVTTGGRESWLAIGTEASV